MVERGGFLANPKPQIMYPNEENMIVVPIAKGMEIITIIQDHLISLMNVNYRENGEKKAFPTNPKHQ